MMEVVGGILYEWWMSSHADVQKRTNRYTIAKALWQDSKQQWPTPHVDTITAWTKEAVAIPLTMASLPDGKSEVTHVVEVTAQEIAACKAKMDRIFSWSHYDTLAEPERLSTIMSAFHTVAPEIMQLAWDNDTAWRAIEHAIAESDSGIISLRDLSRKGGNSCASMTALSSGVLALYGYDASPIAGTMTREWWHAYLLIRKWSDHFLCDPNNPLNKWTENEQPALQDITPSEYQAHSSKNPHTLEADFGTWEKIWFANNVKMAA